MHGKCLRFFVNCRQAACMHALACPIVISFSSYSFPIHCYREAIPTYRIAANFRMIHQNPLRIKFRSFNFRMLCCTHARTYAHAKISQFLFSYTERVYEIYENLHHTKISHYTVGRVGGNLRAVSLTPRPVAQLAPAACSI